MPPASTTPALPLRIRSRASMTVAMPDPQTLLTVIVGTDTGRPAASTAWRAGACPTPACSTQPIRAWSISRPSTPRIRQAGARGRGGKLRRGERRQRPLKRADGGAAGGDDHDGFGAHWILPALTSEPAGRGHTGPIAPEPGRQGAIMRCKKMPAKALPLIRTAVRRPGGQAGDMSAAELRSRVRQGPPGCCVGTPGAGLQRRRPRRYGEPAA